jgi:hypothetical protein
MSLADIRAKLQAQDNRSQTTTTKSPGDKALYPFWNIKSGETAQVRLLPDSDPTNSFFWIEKAVINLTFQGVKGNSDDKKLYTVKVPCMEMYGENCPILAEVRTWYKDDSLKDIANKYWKKRTYLFQGFVKTNPLLNTGNPKTEDTPPENPIRRFVVTPQLFAVIKAAMMNPEIEELPTDYQRGLNFNIIKGTKGEYADYSTSTFARKETPLTELEVTAIDTFGLYNLKEFLPKKPSESELRIIKDMFEASVDGRPYDADKWAAYYKPWDLEVVAPANESTDSVSDEEFVNATVSTTGSTPPWDDEPVATTEEIKVPVVTAAKSNANDILALIRSRQNKPA